MGLTKRNIDELYKTLKINNTFNINEFKKDYHTRIDGKKKGFILLDSKTQKTEGSNAKLERTTR